ncbi:MAG: hypothetical protein KIT80_16310 [Chitinophagaceae bacterium]|nr:hypothetical protein [Chitinophagaceae bacterium]MCW5928481.1 hypothetical protein [Chitinophagaceae bacterium]
MNGEQFYQYLVDVLAVGDTLHTGKGGSCYVFTGWYKGNLQFAGTQTKSIPKAVLVSIKDAMNNNTRITAEWLRANDLESFASRVALVRSIVAKYSCTTEPGMTPQLAAGRK